MRLAPKTSSSRADTSPMSCAVHRPHALWPGLREGGRDALQAIDLALLGEITRDVERASRWRGVEPDQRHVRQQRQRVVEQPSADAAAAHGRVDQHHADPAKLRAVSHGRDSADNVPLELGDTTAVGTQRKKLLPVPADLIPAADAAEPEADVDVGRAHRAQGDRVRGLPRSAHLGDRILKRRLLLAPSWPKNPAAPLATAPHASLPTRPRPRPRCWRSRRAGWCTCCHGRRSSRAPFA